jgi:hypothetical protein
MSSYSTGPFQLDSLIVPDSSGSIQITPTTLNTSFCSCCGSNII